MTKQAFIGATVFDGTSLWPDAVLVTDAGRITAIEAEVPKGAKEVRLAGGILAPGFIDLQVNGGGGHMVGSRATPESLASLCALHARLGATGILPTLITDTEAAMDQVIAAAIATVGQPGFLGLHLEGPHLDPRRKGAHDPALIRPMGAADLDRLLRAAKALPLLKVTLAPASATEGQIRALADAGVLVSLGHADCSAAEALAARAAGARCATHLFNAMSQIQAREPGLVGAVLGSDLAAGIIADGIHVHPQVLQMALAARPEGLFLVSDAMAVAGTDLDDFTLGGRRILRHGGRLTLEDGTLAGADLTLPQAVRCLVDRVGAPPARALAMASRIPADLIGRPDLGRLTPGAAADLVHLSSDFQLLSVWQAGRKLS